MKFAHVWRTPFGLVGFVLLLLLASWIVYILVSQPILPQIPEPAGPAIRGEDPKMPVKKMEEAVERARQAMDSNYRSAHHWRWCSRAADWVGFLLTAFIAVIVGATGQILQQGSNAVTAANTAVASGSLKQGSRLVKVVGVMAALSSVMIGISSRFQLEAQSSFEQAEKLRGRIASSRKEFVNASPEDALRLIEELDAETKKN